MPSIFTRQSSQACSTARHLLQDSLFTTALIIEAKMASSPSFTLSLVPDTRKALPYLLGGISGWKGGIVRFQPEKIPSNTECRH